MTTIPEEGFDDELEFGSIDGEDEGDFGPLMPPPAPTQAGIVKGDVPPWEFFGQNKPASPKPGRRTGGFHPDVEAAIDDASGQYGVDRDLMRAFARIESSGDPRNVTGRYKGLFQLDDDEFRRHGGAGDIFDPVENSRAAAVKLRAQTADFEKSYGRTPSASELYMIHQQGVGGADNHWRNPDAPAWENMYRTAEGRQKGPSWAKQAIWGNLPDADKRRFGSVENITSGDFTDIWDRRVREKTGGDAPIRVAQGVIKGDVPPWEFFAQGKPANPGAEKPAIPHQPTKSPDQIKDEEDERRDVVAKPSIEKLLRYGAQKEGIEAEIRQIRKEMDLAAPADRQKYLLRLEEAGERWKKTSELEAFSRPRGVFDDLGLGILTPAQAKSELDSRIAEIPGQIADQERLVKELEAFKAGHLGDKGSERTQSVLREIGRGAEVKEIIDGVIDHHREKLAELKDESKKFDEMAKGLRPGFQLSPTRAAVEHFSQSIAGTALSIPKFAGYAAGYLGRKMGVSDPETNSLVTIAEWADDVVKMAYPGDPARQKDFSQKLAQGAGSMVGFMGVGKATQLLTGGSKLAGTVGTAITGGASQGAETVEEATAAMRQVRRLKDKDTGEAKLYTPEERDRLIAAGWGFLLGTTEAIPIERALRRPSGGSLRQILEHGKVGALEEGTQELGQSIGGNIVARTYYDPTRNLFEGAGEATLIGGILGFKMGAGKATIDAWKGRHKEAKSGTEHQRIDSALETYFTGALGRGEIEEKDIEGIRDEIKKTRPEALSGFDATVSDWRRGTGKFQPTMTDAQPDDLDQPGNVLAAARSRTTPPPLPGQVEQPETPVQPEQTEQTEQPLAATPAPITIDEMSVLRRLGYTEEDIRDMDPLQRASEMEDARSRGITPDQRQPSAQPPPVPPRAQDRPSAEPVQDLLAQAKDLANQDHPRQGFYLSRDNLDALIANPEADENLAEILASHYDARVLDVDGRGGVLVAKTPEIADQVRRQVEQGADIQSVLGHLTGAGNGKPANASAVVQQVTPEGAVTRESAVTQDQINPTVDDFQADGRSTRVVTPQSAIARREQGRTTPPPLPGEVDQSRQPPPLPGAPPTGDGSRASPVKVQQPDDVARAGQRVVEPTEAQSEAGNYKKGHIKFQGFDITIENPKGSVRKGVSPDGKPWQVTMPADYGYFKRSEGKDGDHVDVYVGGDVNAPSAFVVDQINPDTRDFDEHKIMLGFPDLRTAAQAYHGAFSDGRAGERVGGVTEMPLAKFKDWLSKGRRTRPVAKLTKQPDTESVQPTETIQKQLDKQPDIYDGSSLTPTEVETLVKAWRYVDAIEQARAAGREIQQRRLDIANELDADLSSYGVDYDSFPTEQSVREYLGSRRGADQVGDGRTEAPEATEAEGNPATRPGRDRSEKAKINELGSQDRGRAGDGAGERDAEVGQSLLRGKDQAREHVLSRGRETGLEYGAMVLPDGTMKENKQSKNNTNSFLEVSPETAPELWNGKPKSVDLHHNHPRSSSFSRADYTEAAVRPALRRTWVHGHDGSEYWASFNTDKPEILGQAYNIAMAATEFVTEKGLNIPRYRTHLIAEMMSESGLIEYGSELTPADAQERIAVLRDKIGNRWGLAVAAIKRIGGTDVLDNRPGPARSDRDLGKAPGKPEQAKPEVAGGRTVDEGSKPSPGREAVGETTQVVSPREKLRDKLLSEGFDTIVDARKFARSLGFNGNNKALDEIIEAAVVDAAREIVQKGKNPAATYSNLVSLYDNQPNLASRTGTSVANQAYSTPMPLAYLASRLAGIAEADSVYEPTAGNGALLIEANPNTTTANELDSRRAESLRAQGFTVTESDGSLVPTAKDIDAVIMNPPFGAVKEGGQSKEFTVGDWQTTQIDHAVAINGLQAMDDNGRAVLILGGIKAQDVKERRKGYRGQAKREFYFRLYNQYNVVDHFTVSGDLYKKQGAVWPVDVIVIDGRGKSDRALPAASPPAVLNTWDELAEKLPNASNDDRAVDKTAGRPVEPVGQSADGNAPGSEPDSGTRSERPAAEPKAKPARVRKAAAGGQSGSESATAAVERNPEAGLDRDGGRVDQPVAPREPRVKTERKAPPKSSGQANYEATSTRADSLDTLIPVNMADAAKSAMQRITARHGSVDDLVADRLGYKPDELAKYFSAEQIDAIASAIDNAQRGAAFIIGDQCVAGDTRIYDPVSDTYTDIKTLADRGQPIKVLALTPRGFKAVTATAPFKKGTADLYRVTLDDGRAITVTRQHRFLTPSGWLTLAGGLGEGCSLGSAEGRLLKNLDGRPSVRREDDSRCSRKVQGCLGDCSACSYPCGEQLLAGQDNAQEPTPSPSDVLERIQLWWQKGDLETSEGYSRQHQQSGHHSRSSSSQAGNRALSLTNTRASSSHSSTSNRTLQNALPILSGSSAPDPEGVAVLERTRAGDASGSSLIASACEHPHSSTASARFEGSSCASSRSAAQSDQTRTLGSSDPECVAKIESVSAFEKHTGWRRIVSIEFIGHDAFYDMWVPGFENYMAEGLVNHNTGIGKGRTAAGMLRYAMKQGMTPVFVTEKPDLYGDMFRDLRDIGVPQMLGREPSMFITNAGATIPLDEEALAWKQEADAAREAGTKIPAKRGKFLSGGTAPKIDATMRKIANGEALGTDGLPDVIFTTYDQMNTVKGQETDRRRFLTRIASDSFVVLDESHNAGGAAKTGWEKKGAPLDRAAFVRELAAKAKGVLFSSATYAKRPDVMDLYARTDMGRAVDDPKQLPALIQRGGVPMQQIVASMLANSGQYLRRERSFEGVEYAVEGVPVNQKSYRQFSDAVRAIFKFDLAVKEARKEIMEDILDAKGMAMSKDSGVGESAAHTTAFASIMHNIVNQMLLAIKAGQAAKRAIAATKAGEKPVIALANTNESFIKDFAEQENVTLGQVLDMDFGEVLRRYLARTLRVTIKHPDKTKEHVEIPVERLSPGLQRMYRDSLAEVNSGAYEGMPISPIDWIRHEVGQAGLKVAEVTGRQTMIDYSASKPKYVSRPKSEMGPAGKRGSIAAFNRGALDVLILNRSGSTGVSMHASDKFRDQRKRRMIIAQAEGNIDTHCIDAKTEILTPDGFKGISDQFDTVAAFDSVTGAIAWEKVSGRVERPLNPDESMYGISSPGIDVRVTNNHRMLMKHRRQSIGWRFETAEDVSQRRSNWRMPVAGLQTPGDVCPLTDHELGFIGWVLTDGSINYQSRQIVIWQAEHQPHHDHIKACIEGCGFKYGITENRGETQYNRNSRSIGYTISLGQWRHLKEYLDKDFPLAFENLDRRQLSVLLHALHLGDGTKFNGQQWTRRSYHIATGRKVFADRLQSLCIRRGFRCNVSLQTYNLNPLYMIRIKDKVEQSVGGPTQNDGRPTFAAVESDAGETVWCVENRLGTLITRRNGKVAFLGNCQMLGRVHRTGQVQPPAYTQIAAEIPAEARPTAVLMKKMASLNANTTGARGSVFMADSVDFMNEIGDKVVADLLGEDSELDAELGGALKVNNDGIPVAEDAAKRATGRLVLLTPERQSEFLERVQKGYKSEIEQLDALGENPLEAKTVDLQAKTLDTTVLKPKLGDSPFLDEVRVEKVSVKAQGRAMLPSDIAAKAADALKVSKPDGAPDVALRELEGKGRTAKDAKVRDTVQRAREWIRTDIADLSPDAKESTRKRHESQIARWVSTMNVIYPGSRVTLTMPAGDMEGIVMSVERTGTAKLPVALGSWEARIAVPDGAREYVFPFSKLFPPSEVKGDGEKGAAIAPSPNSHQEMVAAFEDARKEGRETRFMVTGNILGGFDQVAGKGRIVNYTTDTGEMRPGVLMGREFELEKFMGKRAIRFHAGEQVTSFLDKVPAAEVKDTDGNVSIKRHRGEFTIEMPASRSVGGKFFTDPDVRKAIAPRDFERRGNKMIVMGLPRADATAAIEAMRKIGAIFETREAQDVAQGIVTQDGGLTDATLSGLRSIHGYKTEPRKGDRNPHVVMRRLSDKAGNPFLARVVENGDDITVEMYDDKHNGVAEDKLPKGASRLGRKLGYVDLNYMGVGHFASHGHRGPLYEVGMVEVEEDQRMRGLAKSVYNMIEEMLGTQMMPSGTLLPPGYEHWKRRDPELVRGHQYHRGDEMYYSPKKIKADMDSYVQELKKFDRDRQIAEFVGHELDWTRRYVETVSDKTGVSSDLLRSGDKQAIADALVDSGNVMEVAARWEKDDVAAGRKSDRDIANAVADKLIFDRDQQRMKVAGGRRADERLKHYKEEVAIYRGMWRKVPKDLRTERAREAMFSVADAPAPQRQSISRLDYVKGRILLRQPVDLSKDADRMFDMMKGEDSALPDSIPETVVTKLLPKLGSPGRYIVTARDKDGNEYSYEDDSKLIPKTQGMYLLLDGRPAVTLLPLDFGGDFVQSVVAVRAHESVHALRVNGFLPGNGRDLGSAWGRLVGHADLLGVLHMSRAELYARMGDPRSETASKEVTTLEVYTELYGTRKHARELLDQEAVAHMVEVYKLGGWTEQEVAPVKDLLDDILSGRTGQQERGSISLDMLRSIQDTETGQSMRRDLDALGYYSKALEAARALKQAKGTPEQMLAQLKKAGVKDSEIEATGLAQLLKEKAGSTTALESDAITHPQNPQQQGDRTASPPRRASLNQITKSEIISHLEGNRVGVKEVNRETLEGYNKRLTGREQAGDIVVGPDGEVTPDNEFSAAKWSSYSLDPSNPTYRETVLHLPGRGGPEFVPNTAGDWGNTGIAAERAASGDMMRNPEFDRLNVVMGHFSEPNIIGHLMTSMTRHEGKPVYTIDQIQSDWGQKLRDGGVRDEAKIAALEKELAVIGSRSADITETPAWTAADEFLAKIGEARLGETAYDDTIDVLRDVARGRTANEYPDDVRSQANKLAADFKAENERRLMVEAELATAKTSSPGHPLVNTTDQWTTTTLRRAIRQAVEADADYIAIPHGDTVLSYNPGDEAGMRGFYGSRNTEGIVPKNLRKILEKIDKDSARPTRVTELETSSDTRGYRPDAQGKFDKSQTGFTLFPITEKVKEDVMGHGQPMFALGGFKAAKRMSAAGHPQILSAYKAAQALADRGKSPADVWRAAGWMQGADGLWRFEIDDSKAKVRLPSDLRKAASEAKPAPEPKRKTWTSKVASWMGFSWRPEIAPVSSARSNAPLRIGDVLEHPALYQAYPSLKTVHLNITTSGPLGSASIIRRVSDGKLILKPLSVRQDVTENVAQFKTTLLHELQHYIQRIEGFAAGSAPNPEKPTKAPKGKGIPPILSPSTTGLMARPPQNRGSRLFGETMGELMVADYDAAMERGDKAKAEKIYAEIINLARIGAADYMAEAGETEAREVQDRAGLSATERRASMPNLGGIVGEVTTDPREVMDELYRRGGFKRRFYDRPAEIIGDGYSFERTSKTYRDVFTVRDRDGREIAEFAKFDDNASYFRLADDDVNLTIEAAQSLIGAIRRRFNTTPQIESKSGSGALSGDELKFWIQVVPGQFVNDMRVISEPLRAAVKGLVGENYDIGFEDSYESIYLTRDGDPVERSRHHQTKEDAATLERFNQIAQEIRPMRTKAREVDSSLADDRYMQELITAAGGPIGVRSETSDGFGHGQPLFAIGSDPRLDNSLEARKERAEAINEVKDAINIVHRIAGLNIELDMRSTINPNDIGVSEDQLGATSAAGLTTSTAGGFYRKANRLNGRSIIGLALNDPAYDVRTIAGHEAFHHVEEVLATDSERKLIRSASEMKRMMNLAAAEIGMRPSDPALALLPAVEIRAIAFQRYRRMREEGLANASGIHIGIRKLFDRLARIFHAVRNVLAGRGFNSFESVFEQARTGALAEREARSRVDRRAASAPAVASGIGGRIRNLVDPQMRPQGQVPSEPFDVATVALVGRSMASVPLSEIRTIQNSVSVRAVKAKLGMPESDDGRPVSVFKYGETYYVNDGNHRIEAMRARGAKTIRAEVIEITSRNGDASVLADRGSVDVPAQSMGAEEDYESAQASLIPTAAKVYTQRWIDRLQPKLDNLRIAIQDKALPIRRQEEAIEASTGAVLQDQFRTYMAEAIYHGRAGERLIDLQQDTVDPLIEHLRKSGINFDTLGDYLYARHAIERNAAIVQIDPGNVSGSGMTDAEAQGIIGALEQGPRGQAFKDAAVMVDKMLSDTRDTLLRSGLITREQYDNWSTKYQHYVPLRGFEADEDENGIPRIGRGMDIRGPEAMQALGRRSKADNPAAYAMQQAVQAIIRSEKNRVDKTLYRAINAHPDPDVWRVFKGEAKRRINPTTGLVEVVWVPPPFAARSNENVFGVKIAGKQYYMEILHEPLARSLRSAQPGILGTAAGRALYKASRFYAQLVTSYNPEFVISNYLRDIQTALMNVGDVAQKPDGTRKKIVAEALSLKSIRGVMAALQSHEGRTIFGAKRAADETMIGTKRTQAAQDYAKWFDEYRLAGGKISFIEQHDIDRIKTRIEKSVSEGKIKRGLRNVFDLVDNANSAVENGVRLSVYIALRKHGISQDRAAFIARELTVNFNRKGEWGPAINAFYLFFNASMQGTTRLAQAAMRSQVVRRGLAGIFLAGALMDVMNYMIAADDDDGENSYEKIKDWVKEKNMIVMLPGRKDYVQIPMPYGYNVFYLSGQKTAALARTAMGKGKEKPANALAGLLGAVLESFSPFGAAATPLQMVSPTLLDPFVQITENKNWFGGPIQPTKFNKNKPDSENFYATAPSWAVDLARSLNKISGGNTARSGNIDVSPETIEHLVEFAGGGVAKFAANIWNTGDRAYRGQEWAPEKTPFVRRIYGKATTESRRRDFFEKWNDVDAAHFEFDGMRRAQNRQGMDQARQEYGPELAVYESMRAAQRQLAALRKRSDTINLARDLDKTTKEQRLKEITDRENEIILRALAAYNRIKKDKEKQKEAIP